MAQVKLKRLFSKRKKAAAIVNDLIETSNLTLSVQDTGGNVLLGGANADSQARHPVTCEGSVIGWVIGPENAAPIAGLIEHLAEKEAEKDTLADATLEHYRELNMLYNLSEKLADSLEVVAVAQTALDEATRLITATGGYVMLLDEEQEIIHIVTTFGQVVQSSGKLKPGQGMIGQIAQTGKGEIVNDIQADPRYEPDEIYTTIRSLVCAPLKVKNKVTGWLVLVSEHAAAYTAKDLKLLNTLASQAAPAIENALLYETTLREAKEREERLQRQIQELRIELDEARQDKQVAEITETDYFRQLRGEAEDLRKIIKKS